jgi:hypothetical protein
MAKTRGSAPVPPRPDAIRPMDLHACCVDAIRARNAVQRGTDGDTLDCPTCGGGARFVAGAWQYGGGRRATRS